MKKLIACLSVLGILLVSCAPAGDDGTGPIKLGFLGALTGDAAALSADQLHAVQMAVEELNAAGGINGRMVEIVAEDGKCSGTDAASAVQKLVNIDKVPVIIGGLCSGETLAASPIVESAKVVLLSPGSSSPDITKAGDFVFRNYPSDAWKTKAMAKYANESELKRIAILSENTDYSQALLASLKADLPEGAVVFDESFEPGTKDYRSLLTRLQSMEFDALVANANSDALSALIVQQFRDMGFKEEIIGADTMESAVVIDIGEAAEGVTIINVPTAGEGTPYETKFIAKYGAPQSSIAWASYAHDAANVLFDAMKAVGTDGSAIRDYLYEVSYSGIIGSFTFDDNGDPVGISYVLKKIENGKIVTKRPLPLE